MKTETVPTPFAASLLKLVAEQGYPVTEVIEQAGLKFNPLHKESPHYQKTLTPLEYSNLYRQVLTILQDKTFGFQSGKGRGMSPGAFRMLCYCLISCETLGHALRRASQFYKIFFDQTARLELVIEDDVASMGFTNTTDRMVSEVESGEIYGLTTWHRFCCWLIGQPLKLYEVHFEGSKVNDYLNIDELFEAEIFYNAKQNMLRFPAHYLNYHLIQSEQSLRLFLKTAPYQLMVIPKEKEPGIVAQVRSMLGQDFSEGLPGFEQIAGALNMSAPTLRRHLRKEGTTYQQLKDECRCTAAVAYLKRRELSINAVAALMGFTDPSAFHRSFKKWQGVPPGEFRRQLQEP